MHRKQPTIITQDMWTELKQFTDARISLGRCGTSLPLHESLAFKLAHAKARDAVLQPFKMDWLARELKNSGYTTLQLTSSVADRREFLTRPDKGRRLDDPSRALLTAQHKGGDLAIVIGDGLSPRAIHENALPFIQNFMALVSQTNLTTTPICLVKNARVAVADEIAYLQGSRLVIMLIGERPGLSSPNSLGIYMTYAPKPGTTDESRNCISNIRQGGMRTKAAAQKLAYLVETALQSKTSGIQLKDRMSPDYLPFGTTNTFLEP